MITTGDSVKFVSISRADYDSLASKDPGTVYFIQDESINYIIVDGKQYGPSTLTKADILTILGYEEQTLAITDENNEVTSRNILVKKIERVTNLIDEDITVILRSAAEGSGQVVLTPKDPSVVFDASSVTRWTITNPQFVPGESVIEQPSPFDNVEVHPHTAGSAGLIFNYERGRWAYNLYPKASTYIRDDFTFQVYSLDWFDGFYGTFTAHLTIDIVE